MLVHALAEVELGKINKDPEQVEYGVGLIRNTMYQFNDMKMRDKELHTKIMAKYKLASKVRTIMSL